MIGNLTLTRRIRRLEERLLEPEVRASAVELDGLLDDEFMEFSSDGSVYTKARIIASLRAEAPRSYSVLEFRVRPISEDAALATFRLVKHLRGERKPIESLRSSLWKFSGGRWRMAFHQGTRCAPNSG
jgi:glyoxylase I family protein